MNRVHKKGFTIVEMLMVIGVLAVLMGIVTTASSAAIRQARSRRMEAIKAVVQSGIATFRSQHDYWPPKSGGTLDKWSTDGWGGSSVNGVNSGNSIAFLSAEQYDDMMSELAKVSVGKQGASPVMDVMGIPVARKAAADTGKGRGIEFSEAIKKNKKHGSTLSLRDMVFGYADKEHGYFHRFIVQYNAESDSVTVMTKDDYETWWNAVHQYDSASLKWPTGYKK